MSGPVDSMREGVLLLFFSTRFVVCADMAVRGRHLACACCCVGDIAEHY